MLKPIHDAGNIDGYGMQGRLSDAYPTIAMLKDQIQKGLTVADEISISEADTRSDLEPNPDYDPSQPTRPVTAADGADPAHQWPTYGSCSWANKAAANGNTFDVCNSPVRRIPAWGTGKNDALANSPDIMKKQADFEADWMDLLIANKDKVKYFDMDGTNDSSTFNSTDGAHLWSGLTGNPEKYSFFAFLGAPAREQMRDQIARVNTLVPATYSSATWQQVLAARDAAQALVNVRIYSLADLDNVKNATTALSGAIGDYQATTANGDVGGSVPATLALTLGAAATFGPFTPGVDQRLHGLDDRQRDLVGRRRRAQRERPGLPDQRRVRAVGAARGGVLQERLDRAGLQRPGDDLVPPAHRREPSTAHRHLRQDADVHAVDDDALATRLRRGGLGRRARFVEVVADGLEVGVAGAALPLGGDDLAAPLRHSLDLRRRAERAGHGVHRRRSGSHEDQSAGSGREIETPSPARIAVSQSRISARWWAAVCLTSPASRAAA